MQILGIHDGHTSGATLLSGGVVEASVSEERLTRKKNDLGYPARSIEEVLSIGACEPRDLDAVVYASNFMHSADHLARATEWYRAGIQDQIRDSKRSQSYLKAIFDQRREERVTQLMNHLEISRDQISFEDHHLSHAAAAYYGSPFPLDEPTLIITCDGAGDGLSATVSIGRGSDIKRIAATPRRASLGKVYSRVTYLLGLTPWEHEYKVMGLAPYADERYGKEVRDILAEHLRVSENGLGFELCGEVESSYTYEFLRERMERKRFDAIALGTQMFAEEMLASWVAATVRHTGIRRVVCGGGVFMNVKANLRVSQLEGVDELFICPSCGDESLSIGAAWLAHYRGSGGVLEDDKPHLRDLYLGRSFSRDDIERALDSQLSGSGCAVALHENIDVEVAERLARNEVVARFSGRMEWGARALGNRSILANPREWSNIERINAMIKKRDFWMPFAPSLLAEDQHRYLVNPKGIASPFMMLAYDTVPEASRDIRAAVHPRDRTARAQFVSRDTNPGYWSLIEAFKGMTGCSAVLNTSFNLHGYPLVNTPEEAVDVFLRSGLDHLAAGDFLVSKPTVAERGDE